MNPMMENKPEGKNYEYKETEDTVEQQPFPAALVFEQPKPVNPVMKKNTPFFLGVAILYSISSASLQR